MRKKLLITCTILLVILTVANGETILLSLEEIASYGAEHSLDYKNSQLSVLRADEEREGLLLLKNSSISVETSILEDINGNVSDSDSDMGLGYSSTLTVPVIEQISLSASVYNDLSTHMGISLNPLAHSSTQKESELNYNSSIISANGAMISTQIDAVGSALSWM